MTAARAILSACFLFALPLRAPAAEPVPASAVAPVPTLDAILRAWSADAAEHPGVGLSWMRDFDFEGRFSRLESEGAGSGDGAGSAEGVARGGTLTVDGDRIRCDSTACVGERHGLSVFATPLEPSQLLVREDPERVLRGTFNYHRGRRFDDPGAERRARQRWSRTFDGRRVVDRWHATRELYPRATLHGEAPRGSREWALLAGETEIGARLLSLDLTAAVLSVRPGHPLLLMQPATTQWTVEPRILSLGGRPCLCLRDEAGPKVSRRLFVESGPPMRIRGYLGRSGGDHVRLAWDYRDDDPVRAPLGWSILEWTDEDQTTQKFVRSRVSAAALDVREGIAAEGSETFDPGTWVVDRTSGRQDIRRGEGERREVTRAELEWFPTYEELLATDPGRAGELVQRQLESAQMPWSSGLIGTGIAALLSAAAIILLRSRRAGRLPPAESPAHP